MGIALFDLDNTLIAGDSDYLWGCFLVEQGIVDGATYERENLRFYDQYKLGELDIHEFLDFQLRPLAEHDMETLQRWRRQYIEEKITPILLPRAHALLDRHRQQDDTPGHHYRDQPLHHRTDRRALRHRSPAGHRAGNQRRPLHREDHRRPLLPGRQGRVAAELAGRTRDRRWRTAGSTATRIMTCPCSDKVTHPVAVDPDEILRQHADEHGWPVISLR